MYEQLYCYAYQMQTNHHIPAMLLPEWPVLLRAWVVLVRKCKLVFPGRGVYCVAAECHYGFEQTKQFCLGGVSQKCFLQLATKEGTR